MMTDDQVLKNMMAYSEIWTILNLLEDSYASRVPQQVKAFFDEERLKDYVPQIDVDRPLTEQNLQRETLVLLAMLNVNYWCDSEEERKTYLMEMAKNDNKDYDPDDTSWDLSHIFDDIDDVNDKNVDEYPTKREEDMVENNIDMSNSDYSARKPIIISTIMGDVDIKEEPVILKRCQICACEPQSALEDCFKITKREKFLPFLTVENLGFGDAAVVKTLRRGQNLTFELRENVDFRISGNASIETEICHYNPKLSFQEIKSTLKIGISAYEDCKVYLSFCVGESYNLEVGECIIPRIDFSEERAILSYTTNDWYDPDWGDDW